MRGETMSTIQIEKLSKPDLTRYLINQKWISSGEEVVLSEQLTQGNMNLCLRITTPKQKLVIKQGRAWVEKYPHIPAPVGRTTIEALFYQSLSGVPFLAASMPKFIGVDHDLQVMATVFIENSMDGNFIYSQESGPDFFKKWSADLLDFLQHLSLLPMGNFQHQFDNLELKKLNAFHMYDYPFQKEQIEKATQDFNLDLTWLMTNKSLQQRKKLSEDYLNPGRYLIHGDFYPGSFLVQKIENQEKIFVFDPEFCTLGRREFDVGVLMAHMILAMAQPSEILRGLEKNEYVADLNFEAIQNIAAYEILRRILGVAQVLHDESTEKKKNLILIAKNILI